MLEALPAGLVAFPGSDIADKARKARKLGIPVWRFYERTFLASCWSTPIARMYGMGP